MNDVLAHRDSARAVSYVAAAMSTKRAVSTPEAPAPQRGAPYSQAIVGGPFVFVSGQLPIDATTGRLVGDDIEAQTEQALRNLGAVLVASGSALEAIVKTTVFLIDIEDWAAMNDVYARFAGAVPPARSAIQCGPLPMGARIEIEAIALLHHA